MSYHRKGRRALSGLASRAPGRVVSQSALTPRGGFGSLPVRIVRADIPRTLIAGRRMVPRGANYMLGGLPDWYEKMQGLGSLGDDTLAATTVAQQQLEAQQQTVAAIQKQTEGDRFQKWVQIGVTASIPVFGALWRALGIGRRKKQL